MSVAFENFFIFSFSLLHKLARIHDCQLQSFRRRNALQQNVGKYSYIEHPKRTHTMRTTRTKTTSMTTWTATTKNRREEKIKTDFNKFMKHCLWQRENCVFFLPLFVFRSQHEIYDKYVGLVESEYWVHITGFIATFWQQAQRNKANIMTGH